jgi:Flp pilus assembly protein TadD
MRLVLATLATLVSLFAAGHAAADSNVMAPPTQNADYEVGAAAIKAADWPRAVTSLNAALRADPDNADIENLLGYAYRKQGQLDPAFRHYERALKLDPKHRGAHEYIGEAYLMSGNLSKAREHLAELDKLCTLSCIEYTTLKKELAVYEHQHASK